MMIWKRNVCPGIHIGTLDLIESEKKDLSFAHNLICMYFRFTKEFKFESIFGDSLKRMNKNLASINLHIKLVQVFVWRIRIFMVCQSLSKCCLIFRVLFWLFGRLFRNASHSFGHSFAFILHRIRCGFQSESN